MELSPEVSYIKPIFVESIPKALIKLSKTILNHVLESLGRSLLLSTRTGNRATEAKENLCMTRFNGSTNLNPTFMKAQFKPQIRTIIEKSIQLHFFINQPPSSNGSIEKCRD